METMRALVYDRPSVCSVRDVPMPVCGEDEVVIKVMAASICKGADRRSCKTFILGFADKTYFHFIFSIHFYLYSLLSAAD